MTINSKTELFKSIYEGRIPERVPISAKLPFEACIDYAGLSMVKAQWTFEGAEDAYDILCRKIHTDAMPVGGEEKNPAVFKILDSQGYQVTSSGSIQHSDCVTLFSEEYDRFIENPMDFFMEKVLPRMFKGLDCDAAQRSFILAKASTAFNERAVQVGQLTQKLGKKYGFFTPPAGSSAVVRAPFDLLGDFLRGFKGISSDLRRMPEKIGMACDALLPFQIFRGLPQNVSVLGSTFIPLHFAGYIRPKDFENIYWPSLKKFIEYLYCHGQVCQLFCENDWMRYLDYLYELPPATRFIFEYGDAQKIKDTLGKKHIISGLYPLTYLKTATKQKCIDKAKEYIDILAPGGNYIFSFDKNPLSLNSINLENYIAVIDYVAENTWYTNAGELAIDRKRYGTVTCPAIPELKTKYLENDFSEKDTTDIDEVMSRQLRKYDTVLINMLLRSL